MTTLFLKNVDGGELQAKIAALRNSEQFMRKLLPGTVVKAKSVADALKQANCDFKVAKWPTFYADPATLNDPNGAIFTPTEVEVATVRLDSGKRLGTVGVNYGLVQTEDSLLSLQVLVEQGAVDLRTVQAVDDGARIRIGAILGATEFPSLNGDVNTICHIGMFEASHDGRTCNSGAIYNARLECLNGMTSRSVVKVRTLKHTSRADTRLEAFSLDILSGLIGDAEAEMGIFKAMAVKPMARKEFLDFATDLVGGATSDEDTKTKQTRRQNQIDELLGYFDGGNQGAGQTAWGAYNSVTRWLEAKREAMSDGIKAAKRFESNISGDGQSKIQKALKALR